MILSFCSTNSICLQTWPKSSPSILTNYTIPPPRLNLHRSSPRRSSSCRSLSPGRPPPLGSEPPNGKNPGPASRLARFKETAKIFLAVLFWMALFFWYSAWDGRNNDGGTSSRPRKQSWFRK